MINSNILTIKQVQNIELNIMAHLHKYLVAHKLRYCLGYGTLLGAVRHQGFIPWDNDMDILMPRPDFEYFLSMVRQQPIAPHIQVIHHTTDQKYHYQVIRVFDARTKVTPRHLNEIPEMGVWVDIFAVDGLPMRQGIMEWKLEFWKQIQRVDLYRKMWKKPIQCISKIILGVLFPNRNQKHERLIDMYAKYYDFESSEYVADTVERNPKPIKLTQKDFNNPERVLFEGHEFFAPGDCDAYLKMAYGDYMKLPPENKRVTHEIDAEWIADHKEGDAV